MRTRPRLATVFLLAVGSAAAIGSAVAVGAQVPAFSPQVKICNDAGYFTQFIDEVLQLDGNCDDADGTAMIRYTPGGFVLSDFGKNKDLPMSLASDVAADLKKISQFGKKKHKMELTVVNPFTLSILVEQTNGPGFCIATATVPQARRCKYEVVDVIANTECSLVETDVLCFPCTEPTCPKYGKNGEDFVKMWVGSPAELCQVKLRRSKKRCVGCKGKMSAPASGKVLPTT